MNLWILYEQTSFIKSRLIQYVLPFAHNPGYKDIALPSAVLSLYTLKNVGLNPIICGKYWTNFIELFQLLYTNPTAMIVLKWDYSPAPLEHLPDDVSLDWDYIWKTITGTSIVIYYLPALCVCVCVYLYTYVCMYSADGWMTFNAYLGYQNILSKKQRKCPTRYFISHLSLVYTSTPPHFRF